MMLSVAALAVLAAACSPTLDWREIRPEGSGLKALFPCRPARATRSVVVQGLKTDMSLAVCAVDGATYSVSHLDAGTPAAVPQLLRALRQAAQANIGATSAVALAASVPDATPHPDAVRLTLAGALPDGSTVVQHLAILARGTVVVQASVLGPAPGAEAVDTFFGALAFSGH